jgi:F-type H+-transporting ATPase subunit delta
MSATKNYVKALLAVTTKEEISSIYNSIKAIKEAAKTEKYKLIISSPVVSDEEKLSFIKSFIEDINSKTDNLLKLLIQNSRLDMLPALIDELNEEICNTTSNYRGVIYSKDELSELVIKDIEDKLSNKTGKNISLTPATFEKDGVKVFVDVLNLEISLYNQDVKDKLIDNIIKAI